MCQHPLHQPCRLCGCSSFLLKEGNSVCTSTSEGVCAAPQRHSVFAGCYVSISEAFPKWNHRDAEGKICLVEIFNDSLTAEVSPWLHPSGCATSEAKNAGKRSRDLGKSAGLIVLLWFWSVLGCFCKVIRKRSSCSSSEWQGHTSFQEIVCIHWLMQFY